MKTAIAYIRVSTQKQGRSGLGLEAQQAAITAFCATYGYEMLDLYVEVETGKGADALASRPQLATALEAARLTGATLVVAKLDRLTRNVEFGANLLNGKIAFKIADMPNADNFQIHIMLAVAEQEREAISKRTIAALAARKERGLVRAPVSAANQAARSAAFADDLKAVVLPMIGQSSRAIAAALNAQGITTSTGGAWQSATVLRMINRLEGIAA